MQPPSVFVAIFVLGYLTGLTHGQNISRYVSSEDGGDAAPGAGAGPIVAHSTKATGYPTQGRPRMAPCHPDTEELNKITERYSMNKTFKITEIPEHTMLEVEINDIPPQDTGFLIVQAHAQMQYLILSQDPLLLEDNYVNSTNPGLVVRLGSLEPSPTTTRVYLTNCLYHNTSVLFLVSNNSMQEPVPGGYYPSENPNDPPGHLPEPFLKVDPNVLTTRVTYRAASFPPEEKGVPLGKLKYETFLSYMYERDLTERRYWDTLIAMSTLEDIRNNAVRVAVQENNNTAEQLAHWFVSYSGVGAVVSVIVSFNGSRGALYSSTVSYGCDFIEAEEYRCTKLVNPLAKLFCASLIFIGGILLMFGHRWLNFTMFMSGFLFTWCLLFLLCVQDQHTNINALGIGTLFGALLGGVLWLMAWHKFQRPFHSSLLIIIMNVIFVGMVVTYFLRYAIVPSPYNMAAFVVFPVFFAILIIAYSIVDIKKVHIFSCTFLGSYAFVVPFAFYFGSSLTYIVINVIGLMTVKHYQDAIGFPPFQVCDIVLLCLWLILFVLGMAYQLSKERSGPPFHPPSLASWRATKRTVNFVFDKMFACLPMDPDPGGAGIEDQPTWMLRISYCFRLLRRKLSCRTTDGSESGYESFQRVRSMSQSIEEPEAEYRVSRMDVLKERVNAWLDRLRSRFRREDEEMLHQTEVSQGEPEDEEQLQDVTGSCCTFRKSQVVLDDAYTTSNVEEVT